MGSHGDRNYDEESPPRLRVALGCREAGLSLEQTRLVMHRDATGREAVIQAQRDRVDQHLAELHRTRRCPGCSDYAASTTTTPQ